MAKKKPFENEGVIPNPMENMIPVTVASIEFERHVEEIDNIGRVKHHNVETNCIVTLQELVTDLATGNVMELDERKAMDKAVREYYDKNGQNAEYPTGIKTSGKLIQIVGRSICHDIDTLDEIEQEKAYADALNKIAMLGYKIDTDSNYGEEDMAHPVDDLVTGGNIFDEAPDTPFDPIGTRPDMTNDDVD